MSRKSEIKKLEKRLNLLKTEEVLMDRLLEDHVITIEDLMNPNIKDKSKPGNNSIVKYRLKAIRKGTTVICLIMDDLGRVLGEGMARCHIDDKFNDSIGFRLAQIRAKEDWSKKSVINFMKNNGCI